MRLPLPPGLRSLEIPSVPNGVQPLSPVPASPAPHLRIVTAEDEYVNRRILTHHLDLPGIEVSMFINGKRAVDFLSSRGPQRIDVIIMDINMPVMNGMEAAQHIRKLPDMAQLPLVAATGNVCADQKANILDSGFDHVIPKPYSAMDLLSAIRTVLIAKSGWTEGRWLELEALWPSTRQSVAAHLVAPHKR